MSGVCILLGAIHLDILPVRHKCAPRNLNQEIQEKKSNCKRQCTSSSEPGFDESRKGFQSSVSKRNRNYQQCLEDSTVYSCTVSKIEYLRLLVIQKYVNPIIKCLQLALLFNRWFHMGTVSRESFVTASSTGQNETLKHT